MRCRLLLPAVFSLLWSPALFAAPIAKPVEWTSGGDTFAGVLVYDDAVKQPRPGLVMVPNWKGVNDSAIEKARLVAGDDYVVLVADVYGSKVVYHGRVAGLGAGTGAAFSLLPAQNATGNWIKVVQRVPVRIELDPKEIAAHPLRVGLSMNVTVDVEKQDGALLAPVSAARADHTDVYDGLDREAEADVQRIIAANRGAALPGVAASRPAARPLTLAPAASPLAGVSRSPSA